MDLRGMRNQLAQLLQIPKTSAHTAPSHHESKGRLFGHFRFFHSQHTNSLQWLSSVTQNSEILSLLFQPTPRHLSARCTKNSQTKRMNQHQKTPVSDRWHKTLDKRWNENWIKVTERSLRTVPHKKRWNISTSSRKKYENTHKDVSRSIWIQRGIYDF